AFRRGRDAPPLSEREQSSSTRGRARRLPRSVEPGRGCREAASKSLRQASANETRTGSIRRIGVLRRWFAAAWTQRAFDCGAHVAGRIAIGGVVSGPRRKRPRAAARERVSREELVEVTYEMRCGGLRVRTEKVP